MALRSLWPSIKENRDLPAFNAVVSAVRTLAAVIVMIVVALPALAGWISFSAALTIACLLAGTGVGILAVRKVRHYQRRRLALRTSQNPGLKHISIERTCKVKSRAYHIYYCKMLVETLIDGVDCYNTILNWTGRGSIEVRGFGESKDILIQDDELSNEKRIKIFVGRPKPRGTRIWIEFSIEAVADDVLPKPYYAETISEFTEPPTDLTITAIFDHPDEIVQVWAEERVGPSGRGLTKHCGEISVKAGGIAIFKPDLIQRGRRYFLIWKYKEAELEKMPRSSGMA